MKIEVLGASGSASLDRRLTSLLINDTIALDAGSLAQMLTIERQERVASILLSHSHLDHTNSLPFFVENVFDRVEGPIDIYASKATIYSVRKHLFNNDSWPDFSRMPNNLLPSMKFHELEPEVPVCMPLWRPAKQLKRQCCQSYIPSVVIPVPPRAVSAPLWAMWKKTNPNGTPLTPSKGVTTWWTKKRP